jgi:hypothetical protein
MSSGKRRPAEKIGCDAASDFTSLGFTATGVSREKK